MNGQELDAVIAIAHLRSCRSRETLCRKGEPGGEVYVIVSGKLKALATSREGTDVVFGIYGAGDVIGEIAIFGGGSRTATIAAIEDSELLVIHRADFMTFLRSHPEAAIGLLNVLAVRLRRVSEIAEDTQFLSFQPRLAKRLADLSRTYGTPTEDGGLRVDVRLSQEEWADLVGSRRETVNRQIRKWAELGVLSMEDGYIVVHRPEELEQLARVVLI